MCKLRDTAPSYQNGEWPW